MSWKSDIMKGILGNDRLCGHFNINRGDRRATEVSGMATTEAPRGKDITIRLEGTARPRGEVNMVLVGGTRWRRLPGRFLSGRARSPSAGALNGMAHAIRCNSFVGRYIL